MPRTCFADEDFFGGQGVEEVEMDALSWQFSGQEISLHQRAESYNSHKFDVKDTIKPLMQLEEGGDEYRLQTIDVHAPSENAVDGVKYAAELQFWHMAPGPKYMVVSVMFHKGGESPLFLNQLSKLLQKGVYQYNKLDPAIDFQSVMKSVSATSKNTTNVGEKIDNFFRFNGSLTEPPCTEGVIWNIVREPLSIFYYDADEIQQDLAPNNRPLQPSNDRTVQVVANLQSSAVRAEAAAHAAAVLQLREAEHRKIMEEAAQKKVERREDLVLLHREHAEVSRLLKLEGTRAALPHVCPSPSLPRRKRESDVV